MRGEISTMSGVRIKLTPTPKGGYKQGTEAAPNESSIYTTNLVEYIPKSGGGTREDPKSLHEVFCTPPMDETMLLKMGVGSKALLRQASRRFGMSVNELIRTAVVEYLYGKFR